MSKTCCSCESFSATFEDLEFKAGLPDEVRKEIRKYDQSFSTRDRRVLYFIVLGLIINALAVLFALGGMNSDVYINRIIVADCMFLMAFTLLITLIRIWIFKYNMLQPIIGLWRQLYGQPIDKWMFFLSAAFAFFAVILMVVAVMILSAGNYSLGIGMTCLDIILYIFSLIFYRLHVSAYIQHAKTCELPTKYDSVV